MSDRPLATIEWSGDDGWHGGSVTITTTGITVHTSCCGCSSDELPVASEQLRVLRDTLDQILSDRQETMHP